MTRAHPRSATGQMSSWLTGPRRDGRSLSKPPPRRRTSLLPAPGLPPVRRASLASWPSPISGAQARLGPNRPRSDRAGCVASACLPTRWWPMAAAPATTCAGTAMTPGHAPNAGPRDRQGRPSSARTRKRQRHEAGRQRAHTSPGQCRYRTGLCPGIHRVTWDNEAAAAWTPAVPDLLLSPPDQRHLRCCPVHSQVLQAVADTRDLAGAGVIGACSHASPGNRDRTCPARNLALPATLVVGRCDIGPVRAALPVSPAAECGFPAWALNQEGSPAV